MLLKGFPAIIPASALNSILCTASQTVDVCAIDTLAQAQAISGSAPASMHNF